MPDTTAESDALSLDAHADFNTHELSPSGNLHGMPVACLCGFGPPELLALAGLGRVPQQFFPNSDRPELIVELRMKEGASFAETTEQVKRMEKVPFRTVSL